MKNILLSYKELMDSYRLNRDNMDFFQKKSPEEILHACLIDVISKSTISYRFKSENSDWAVLFFDKLIATDNDVVLPYLLEFFKEPKNGNFFSLCALFVKSLKTNNRLYKMFISNEEYRAVFIDNIKSALKVFTRELPVVYVVDQMLETLPDWSDPCLMGYLNEKSLKPIEINYLLHNHAIFRKIALKLQYIRPQNAEEEKMVISYNIVGADVVADDTLDFIELDLNCER